MRITINLLPKRGASRGHQLRNSLQAFSFVEEEARRHPLGGSSCHIEFPVLVQFNSALLLQDCVNWRAGQRILVTTSHGRPCNLVLHCPVFCPYLLHLSVIWTLDSFFLFSSHSFFPLNSRLVPFLVNIALSSDL